jgi:hypothetical protein
MLRMQAEGVDEIVISGLRAGKSLLAEAMGGVVVKPTPEFKAGDVVQIECGCWGWAMMAESGGWRIKLVNVDNCPCGHRVGYAVWGHRSRLKHYLQPGDEVELLDSSGATTDDDGWWGTRGRITRNSGQLTTSRQGIAGPVRRIWLKSDRGGSLTWPLSCIRPVRK